MKHAYVLLSIVTILVCTTHIPASDGAGIHTAARLGDVERIARLLDADPALVNARTAAEETPLHYAAAGHHTAVVELLLERGADVIALDRKGVTPLHLAAMLSDAKIVRTLLAAGADVNATDKQGETPLHAAARRFQQASLAALLSAGADVNAENTHGETPLHVLGSAMRVRDVRFERLLHLLVELLFDAGADREIIAGGIPVLREDRGEDEGGGPRGRDDYRTYAEIEQIMRDAAEDYPAVCQFHDLGLTVQDRHIWALNISDNVGVEEDEPEFKYVSTMHGNEWTGNEMCLFFIDHLLSNYGTVPRITNMIDEIDIWIVPLMNPDGFVVSQRENANGVDLNRAFPEWTDGDENTTAGKEPEVAAIMNWTFANSFTCSANFHTGALVVNYPFDDDDKGDNPSPTPDDDLFIYISEEYSKTNLPMWNGGFYHGITNGAAWYSISGGMQDWHYRYMGGNEVTIELSNQFAPNYSEIPGFWDDNRESMLAYMETCLIGVRGIVTDTTTGAPVAATITVVGRDHEVYTDPDVGDYHRMLMPGTYDLHFETEGDEVTVNNVVVSSGDATRLDLTLYGPAQVSYPNGGEMLDVDAPVDVTWAGNPAAQFHVQYSDNYGQSGSTMDDFERTSLGPDYVTGGDAAWFITTDDAHGPTRSARAGDIDDDELSWMTRTIAGGELSFWYRVSSESGWDYFNFYIDGDLEFQASGEGSWVHYTTTLPPGSYVLRWEYDKDFSESHYGDTVYIDDLSIIDNQTTWTDIIALTDPGAMSTPWTPIVISEDYKVRVRAYYGGGYGVWDESDATFEVADLAFVPGDLNCDGFVDIDDVPHLVQALVDPDGYDADHDGDPYDSCDRMLANMNGDETIDGLDVQAFIDAMPGL